MVMPTLNSTLLTEEKLLEKTVTMIKQVVRPIFKLLLTMEMLNSELPMSFTTQSVLVPIVMSPCLIF